MSSLVGGNDNNYLLYIGIFIVVVVCIIIGVVIYIFTTQNKEKAEKEAKEKEEKEALVSKVRIEINKGKVEALQISQLVLLDNNNNIIKPTQINASEPFGPETPKETANDGNRKPRNYPYIYHSSNETRSTAFYEFVIPPTKIKTIEIYNREDCCGERIESFSLYLFNSNNTMLKTIPLVNLPTQIYNIT